jgi:hypothetical protein
MNVLQKALKQQREKQQLRGPKPLAKVPTNIGSMDEPEDCDTECCPAPDACASTETPSVSAEDCTGPVPKPKRSGKRGSAKAPSRVLDPPATCTCGGTGTCSSCAFE